MSKIIDFKTRKEISVEKPNLSTDQLLQRFFKFLAQYNENSNNINIINEGIFLHELIIDGTQDKIFKMLLIPRLMSLKEHKKLLEG